MISFINILFRISVCLLISFIYGTTALNSQSFRLYAVSDLARVFEDGYKLPVLRDSIKVFGIRGEVISAQLTLNSKKSMPATTVEAGQLRNAERGISLPQEIMEWNFVGNIPVAKNAPNQPVSALIRQAPARFPEYLMPERQTDIREKAWQSVWLTIKIPENIQEGTYTGNVTVKCGNEAQLIPVILKVYPLTIPSERHLDIVEWYNTDGFARFHNINEEYSPEWFAMLRKYADNMVEHRQNSFRVDMDVIEIRQSEDGSFSFDFSRFDQIAQIFWNTGKMDYLETGFLALRGLKGWSDINFRWKEFKVKKAGTGEQVTLPGMAVIPSLVSAFEAHLRQKGWLDKTWFHIMDEPALHNALSWIEFSRIIHQYGPDFKRMDAIETTYLLNDIEIAVPKLDHFASWYDSYRKWQQEGHDLWFYSVGIYQGSLLPNKTIDVPLMDSRVMHWLNYKYDATGFLHWGWNQWNDNPYQDVGMHIGDGWHVYPSKDGVLNSLRWEQMRNGIQDYEYFWMLENRIKELKDSLGSRFSWIDPKQRGKEIAGMVISGFADRTNDPEVIYTAKRKLTVELLDFDTSPRIYVQTNPAEKSALTARSSVEVLGWVEPGSKIEVNGTELPVREGGLFMEQFQLSAKNNRIVVRATMGDKTKEIVREFIVR